VTPPAVQLVPWSHVAAPDPVERRVADGAALFCCTGQQAHQRATWRVLLCRAAPDAKLVPAEPDDEQCPECGAPGQQVSEARVWAKAMTAMVSTSRPTTTRRRSRPPMQVLPATDQRQRSGSSETTDGKG
jgi:hypothetical protein